MKHLELKMIKAFSLVLISSVFIAPRCSFAQSDSMSVQFALNGDAIYWNFETTIQSPQGPVVGSYHSGNLGMDLQLTKTIANTNTVCIDCGTPNELSFTVDTVAKMYKGLDIKYQMPESQGQGILVSQYEITFADIPYTQQGSKLSLQGIPYKGSFTGNVMYEASTPNGEEQGSWSSNSSPNFTLDLDVTLPTVSAGVQSSSGPTNSTFQVRTNDASVQFEFAAVEQPVDLTILDLLGRVVITRLLTSGENSLQIPNAMLPPGCYFARHAGEVAKFVVPPR